MIRGLQYIITTDNFTICNYKIHVVYYTYILLYTQFPGDTVHV